MNRGEMRLQWLMAGKYLINKATWDKEAKREIGEKKEKTKLWAANGIKVLPFAKAD